MRTRRVLFSLLATVGLLAACSDSEDDPSVQADDSTETTADGGDAAASPIEFTPLDPGAVTFEALQNGDVDMALLFSTQGVIAENGWVVLEDDMTLQGSDNLIPLIRSLTGSGTIIVGSANFSEAEIVAQMYKIALEAAGYTVELKAQLGSREVLIPALESGEIDVEPEYLQSLLAFLEPATESVTPDEGVALAADLLPEGLTVLDPSPAQDQNAIVVTAETAEKYGLSKVSDLLAVTDALKMAGPPECPERPLCIPGYESVYGLQFDV
jgi:glycine betaine/choline ABC-type transport system substrate-binding protein